MQLRHATINDCADLAILDNIAGHGLPLWLWQDAVARGRADDAIEWGKEHYADLSQPCNWSNAAVATVDGETAGAAVGFFIPEETRFPTDGDAVLAPLMRLFAKAAGSRVLDMLAVYRRFTRRAIARALLRDQISSADDKPVSIVAANDNAPALTLYRSEGFAEVTREPFVPFNDTQTTTSWLLLRRQANR